MSGVVLRITPLVWVDAYHTDYQLLYILQEKAFCSKSTEHPYRPVVTRRFYSDRMNNFPRIFALENINVDKTKYWHCVMGERKSKVYRNYFLIILLYCFVEYVEIGYAATN